MNESEPEKKKEANPTVTFQLLTLATLIIVISFKEKPTHMCIIQV